MSRSFRSISLSSGATFAASPFVLCQGPGGQRDDLLAQRAHFDHLVVELRQLLVKSVSHR